ncbi:MAG: 2-oxo acid dehydrogenase subunit E2, partial [Rubrobacteraceae bacterium]
LNTPQVAILGLHTIQDRPMVVDGEVKVRPMMYLALSYDHRIIDGADAVQFLVRIKKLIAGPESLLLEGWFCCVVFSPEALRRGPLLLGNHLKTSTFGYHR